MTNQSMLNRFQLARLVQDEVGLTHSASADAIESVLDIMRDALSRGESVRIQGFGNFVVRSKSARLGRNPQTGEEVPITPRRVVTFRPSDILRDRVATPAKHQGRATDVVE